VTLSRDELQRYARQLSLPDVGRAGQERLKAARVLLVGTGGLGSPAALYLAAAGVGTLGLIDFDIVDATNLHRQLLHGTKDVGRPKVESARDRLADVNPHVHVVLHREALTSENALERIAAYDLVVDGSDNFPTRYLVNDACGLLGKQYVYGSVQRFDGQVAVFGGDAPCYRCLFREPPPAGLVPTCAEAGVFGVMPGIIGMLQATEALKVLLGIGETLAGRLLLFDALRMRSRTIAVRRDPECPLCGTHEITALQDYAAFCGVAPRAEARADGIPETEPRALAARIASGESLHLLDVREPYEYDIAALGGATLVPLGELDPGAIALPLDATIVVYCHHGMRSRMAAEMLQEAGFTRVENLAGGIDAWSADVDPAVARY
jgi:adenylyltransferase/sulfurtransferase